MECPHLQRQLVQRYGTSLNHLTLTGVVFVGIGHENQWQRCITLRRDKCGNVDCLCVSVHTTRVAQLVGTEARAADAVEAVNVWFTHTARQALLGGWTWTVLAEVAHRDVKQVSSPSLSCCTAPLLFLFAAAGCRLKLDFPWLVLALVVLQPLCVALYRGHALRHTM